jgi:hypothetical protein
MSIEIIREESGRFRSIGRAPASARVLTRIALKDIAGKIQDEAKVQAPMGETGALKAHPVDIRQTGQGSPGFFDPGREGTILRPGESIETRAPSFGGGFTVRGAGGRFVRGGATREPGRRPSSFAGIPEGEFDQIDITVAREPRHAIWVHDGTGIYGPHRSPIVPRRAKNLVFRSHKTGRRFVLPSVKGQKPQPFLDEAFVIINNTYIPVRIEKLRLEIDAVT